MIKYILIFTLLITGISYGQTVRVIDKSEKSAVLFDGDNPRSLVSIVQENALYLENYYKTGIAPSDLKKMDYHQKSTLISFIGEPGNTPILEDDPESPNFGEPKIVEFPDGTLAYVYPAPDTMFIGLKGTDRLVLEIDEDQKDFFKSIESITFCRIVSGEYVPTLRVEGGALLNLQGYGFFDEIAASIRKQLISKKENSYWSLLRDTAMAESDDVYKGLLFLPHAEAYGLKEIKNHHAANDRYLNGEEDGFSRIGNYSNYLNYPFDFYYGDSLFKSPDLIEILERILSV